MIQELSFLLVFFVAFIATFTILPFFIRRMHFRKLLASDLNKLGKPLTASFGGITVLLGFSIAMFAAIFLNTYFHAFNSLNFTALAAGFLTILFIGFLGLIDDLIGWKKGIRQWQHALVPIAAALPLMALNVGTTDMTFPIFGTIAFGIFYSLIIVPIGVTGASNAVNMLAGFNGLEAGMGILLAAPLLAIGLTLGRIEVVILMAALIGALLAFLRFNWFPAKIFGEDSLTLMIGASIASAVIIGNIEMYGIMLFAIYFIEVVLKARHKFQSQCFGIPQADGTLKADPKGGSITHWIMRRGRLKETQVVLFILSIQAIVSILVFADFYFLHFLPAF